MIARSSADASYSHILYRTRPENRLCHSQDSIAGPMKGCSPAGYATLFEIILQHLDEPDLGLGPTHTVEQISF